MNTATKQALQTFLEAVSNLVHRNENLLGEARVLMVTKAAEELNTALERDETITETK